MTEEELNEQIHMLRYFWEEKGDVTRWCEWPEVKEALEKYRPDILMIIENYMKAERAMSIAMSPL